MSKVAELWQFMFFKMAAGRHLGFLQKWNLKAFLFLDVCFCLWTKFGVNVCNCDWVMAIKLNFQDGGRRHLGFCRSEIWRQRQSLLTRIYLHTKFGKDIFKGGWVMTIYVFLKWRPADILDFQMSEIWRYFWDVFRSQAAWQVVLAAWLSKPSRDTERFACSIVSTMNDMGVACTPLHANIHTKLQRHYIICGEIFTNNQSNDQPCTIIIIIIIIVLCLLHTYKIAVLWLNFRSCLKTDPARPRDRLWCHRSCLAEVREDWGSAVHIRN